MKYLLVCCMALSLLVSPETSKEKKLLGVWKFEIISKTEHVSGNIYKHVTSGIKGETSVVFQQDRTGIIKGVDIKTESSFTWELKSGRLTIDVETPNIVWQEFKGTFRLEFSGKKAMRLIDPDGKAILFSR